MDPKATEWSPKNALALAEASAVAYRDDGAEIVKQALSCDFFESINLPVEIQTIFQFEQGRPGPQAFIAAGEPLIVIAYRGTELNLTDLITDSKFTPKILNDNTKGKAHDGFAEACELCWSDLMKKLNDARSRHPSASIWLTGHSLGGGLANMTAAKLIFKEKIAVQSLITFGCPVTGDENFHKELDNGLGGRHWRCVHQMDPVTINLSKLPGFSLLNTGLSSNKEWIQKLSRAVSSLKNFQHGGHAYYLNSDGTLCENGTIALGRETTSIVQQAWATKSFKLSEEALRRHSIEDGYLPALRKLVALSEKTAKD